MRIDMRTVTGRLHKKVTNAVIESVSKPGVKTQIYTELYDIIRHKIPVDTGALRDSPMQQGGIMYMGGSKRYKAFENDIHYAHGDITDKGLIFDPYSVKPDGTEIHYADSVDNFRPWSTINDNKELAYGAIAQILVKEINHE